MRNLQSMKNASNLNKDYILDYEKPKLLKAFLNLEYAIFMDQNFKKFFFSFRSIVLCEETLQFSFFSSVKILNFQATF